MQCQWGPQTYSSCSVLLRGRGGVDLLPMVSAVHDLLAVQPIVGKFLRGWPEQLRSGALAVRRGQLLQLLLLPILTLRSKREMHF